MVGWNKRRIKENKYKHPQCPESHFVLELHISLVCNSQKVQVKKLLLLTTNRAYIYDWISRWPLCFFDFNCFLQLFSRSALLPHHQFSAK